MREDGRSRGEASDCSDNPEQRKTRYVVKDGKYLAKVMVLLNEDLEVTFCGKVVALLHSCFVTVDQRHKELAIEKAMTQFYAVRIRELPALWMALFSDLSLGSVPPLLLQSVNRNVFVQMMVEHFAESVEASRGSSAAELPTMNAGEENALHYVSGYVALKLMRQYEKKKGEKAMQFVETKELMSSVDRGGPFHNL